MFSGSRTTAPGGQKGFKPHTPNFIPWLRNSLKAHHSSSDSAHNGPYKSTSETRSSLTPLERAKGISFFSIQGKEQVKKGELRCNGMRMMPVVLKGHQILPGSLGKNKEDGPARWNTTKELDLGIQELLADRSPSAPRNQSQKLKDISKYDSLVGPPPTPVSLEPSEKPSSQVPVVLRVDEREGKVWDCDPYRQKHPHPSSWLSSDTPRFTSSFGYINKPSRSWQSHRDLTALREPPAEAFSGPLNGLLSSADISCKGLGCSTTVRGPRKARAHSERVAIQDQTQTWEQHGGGESQRRGGSSSRKVVRSQIKRVVDNLENVLRALSDIQQEIKEVVQQIDSLTSTVDLDEEDQQTTAGAAEAPRGSSSSSGSSSAEMTLGSPQQRASETHRVETRGALSRECKRRSRSPPNGHLHPNTCSSSSDRGQTLSSTPGLAFSPRKIGLQPYTNTLPLSHPPKLRNLTTCDHILSPPRSIPARPPTPGLSPLTVNLHHPSSPASQSPGSSSPRVSPASSPQRPRPPPALSPSVIKVGSFLSPQSDLLSVGPMSPALTHSLSASCPPTDIRARSGAPDHKEQRASSAGTPNTCAAKTCVGTDRRGRKPPPYPENRLSEPTKKDKEPRKAPPYPERRKLLSTTV